MRALTSASNIRQRQLCPGSARMEEGLPELSSKESEQGQRLHDYSAHPEYERQLLPPEEQDLLRTADQLEAQAFDAIGIADQYEDKRECELGNEVITGHADLLRVYEHLDVSVITDRKFGWHPVERADVNLQMRVYAVLAPTSETYVAILQPRAAYADRITISKYTTDSKIASRKQIAKILEACEDPNAPLIAGEEQCRYCRARAICPALRDAVINGLVVFKGALDPELSKTALMGRIEERLAQASDEQLGGLWAACALARHVNEPLHDEMRRRIAAGAMTDFKLGAEWEARSIGNARKAISLLVLGGFMTRDQALALCDLSITRVQSRYRELNKGVTEKQAKADINKALDEVLEKDQRKARILRK